MIEKGKQQQPQGLILIKRQEGRVLEVRETEPTFLQDLLARGQYWLHERGLKCGVLSHLQLRTEHRPEAIIFADFKASSEPDDPSPLCSACDRVLRWRPDTYAFGQGGYFYIAAEIGWWKCPEGHPGKIHLEDFQRYAELVRSFEQEVIKGNKVPNSPIKLRDR